MVVKLLMSRTFTFGPKIDQVDFEPIYSLKGSIHQKTFRKFMRQALDEMGTELEDCLPHDIRETYKLYLVFESA